MSQIKLLLEVVNDLKALTESLMDLADAIGSHQVQEQTNKSLPIPISKAEDSPAPRAIPLEEVRKVLAEKSQDGFTAQIRALLQKHGAPKLSAIDPSHYADLLADAEQLK